MDSCEMELSDPQQQKLANRPGRIIEQKLIVSDEYEISRKNLFS